MIHDFHRISKSFTIRGRYHSCEPYGSGHINSTYLLKTRQDDSPDYILQKINSNVFKDIPGLMGNIQKVTSHLRRKMLEEKGGNPEKEILTLIPTVDGQSFLLDNQGNYWRMYIYIWPNVSFDIVPNAEVAFEGGRMFGRFQQLLSDLPGSELSETIPDFHHIGRRLETFSRVLEKDRLNRAVSVREEIAFVEQNAASMFRILELGDSGEIPNRITHNDTKFNNVLFDESEKGLCVIDLDTVMPGYVHYDFGDSIRTATNTAAEDETDLDKVEMNIDIFRGYARGFLSETRSFLNHCELDNLAFSGQLITFIIGLRFLTDFLDGDRYFTTHREGHNRDRCRAQFKLVESQMRQEEAMQGMIDDLLRADKVATP